MLGLHPCPGKDLALFIIKIIMANFLVKFDYELVDKAGAVLPESSMPASEKNSLHMPGLAVGETARIRFRSKEVS
jgi:cytochrome P450